jgi:mRNA-degrading endonuclease RelE of RelBE toxin-antitoxin system
MLKNSSVKVLVVASGTLLVTLVLNKLQYTVALGLLAGVLAWRTWEQSETSYQLAQKIQAESEQTTEVQAENMQLQTELKQMQLRSEEIGDRLELELLAKAKSEEKISELSDHLKAVQISTNTYQTKARQLETRISESRTLQQDYATLQQELKNRDEIIDLMSEEIEQEQDQRKAAESLAEDYFNQVQILGAENIELKERLGQANRKLEAVKVEPATFEDEPKPAIGHYTLKFEYIGDFDDLPDREYKKVMGKVLALQAEPRPHDCDYLRKFNHRFGKIYRVRTGDYRICYTIEESPSKQIRILMVDNRNERIYDERLSRRLS